MSRFPQTFFAMGRRWARPSAARADWSLPADSPELDEKIREAARSAPWLTDEALAAFAAYDGPLCASAGEAGTAKTTGLAEGEHATAKGRDAQIK